MLAACVVFTGWDTDISARTRDNTATLLTAIINHSPLIRDADRSEKNLAPTGTRRWRQSCDNEIRLTQKHLKQNIVFV